MGKKTVNERYIPGDYYMECDRCGLSYRRSDLVRDGYVKGLMVCRSCWDFKPTYPSPPPDRISVPIPRPDNTSVTANGTAFNTITIGLNLFPDPNILPANDGLWSAGVDSQQHAKTEYYSKKLEGVNADITVTGLEIGAEYRLRASTWTYDDSRILIDGVNSTIFTAPDTEQWFTDYVFFTAESESIVLTFVGSALTNWYDDIHVQKYTVEETILSIADILENKPNNDVTIDNTVEGTVIQFFSFFEDNDFNAVGFDDGTFVDTLE